jgi:rhodanese-related sulfurtransferase
MTRRITGTELLAALRADGQVAVLDLRTPADRAAGHIAVSAGISLHELEQRIGELVPFAGTPIVLTGGPDEQGAALLERIG